MKGGVWILVICFLFSQCDYVSKVGIDSHELDNFDEPTFPKSDLSGSNLQLGDLAPDFTAIDHKGKEISLQELIKTGDVVILFYRSFWCQLCGQSLNAFNRKISEVAAKGGRVIAITIATPGYGPRNSVPNEKFVSIVFDHDQAIMKSYGIMMDREEEYHEHVSDFYNPELLEYDRYERFIPATFVIDPEQKIKYIHYNITSRNNVFVSDSLAHR